MEADQTTATAKHLAAGEIDDLADRMLERATAGMCGLPPTLRSDMLLSAAYLRFLARAFANGVDTDRYQIPASTMTTVDAMQLADRLICERAFRADLALAGRLILALLRQTHRSDRFVLSPLAGTTSCQNSPT